MLAHVAAGAGSASGWVRPAAVAAGVLAVVIGGAPPFVALRDRSTYERSRWASWMVRGLVAMAVVATIGRGVDRLTVVVALAGGAAAVVAAAPAGPATAVLAAAVGGTRAPVAAVDRALGVAHVVAGAWWIALVLAVGLAARHGAAARTARRISAPAIALVVVVGSTGSYAATEHLGDAQLALGTWWGRLLLAKVVVVASVAVAGAAVRRGWVPKLEVPALGAAAVAGLTLAAAGGPLAGPALAGPLVRADGVLVGPLTPGPNLVVGPAPVTVDGVVVDGTVDLRSGRHSVASGGTTTTVVVRPVDRAGPVVPATYGPQPGCVDRLAGAVAAATRVPGSRLALAPAVGACSVAGRSTDDWSNAVAALAPLVDRSGRPPVVVGDGAAFLARWPDAEVVTPATLPALDGRVVVVATPVDAAFAVADAAVAGGGPVVLAPWLLDAGLLADLADASLPVLVAAERDPTSVAAVDYRTALAGRAPTAAGFEGYAAFLGAAGVAVPPPAPGVFGLSRVSILPGDLEEGAHGPPPGWAPGVALVRVA